MAAKSIIGRVIATESSPTTMDKFIFWTSSTLPIHAFDIIKVEHIGGSYTYGSIENISHITDSSSFLTGYISNDFGNLRAEAPTERVEMNCITANVIMNTRKFYTPVRNNAPVYLASAEEINTALGLDKIQKPLTCGYITMYAGTKSELSLPVNLDSKFVLGPDGAHLNISGISGLAAKTSYSMFLLKAVQEQLNGDNVSFVIFNVKGRDLMAIDQPNDDLTESERKEYETIGLTAKPFTNVSYYIPYRESKSSSYLPDDDIKRYIADKKLKKFKYLYEYDRGRIEMLFADIDDSYQTTESIISKIMDDEDPDFRGVRTWDQLLKTIHDFSIGATKADGGIKTVSWQKFYRLINTFIKYDEMFKSESRRSSSKDECRLSEELRQIQPGEVKVIDISKLDSSKQAFVFGDALKTIYNLKLGSYEGLNPPEKIIIFIDELNKYASKDVARSSPILHELLDVAERGRSMGVILFGAEQFRSAIHPRVTGNCATNAYGRSNALEVGNHDYSNFPSTYKNILTRLEQGEYLIQNPIFRTLLRVRFPKPVYKQFND